MHRPKMTVLLLLSCSVLLSGCLGLGQRPDPEIRIQTKSVVPEIDPRLETCADWPEQPTTWIQSIIALWITDAREAFDECKADLAGTHETLDEARKKAAEQP